MTAAQSTAAMQAQLDEDMAALMDNFEGLLRCAQISEPIRNSQERLQLGIHAARLAEAAQALLRLTERLKRDALLGDFGGRIDAWKAATSAAEARCAAAVEGLRAAADAEALRLAAEASSAPPGAPASRTVLTHAGEETLLEDADAPPDAVTQRLYEIATMQ